VEDYFVHKKYVVVNFKVNGLNQITLFNRTTDTTKAISFDEDAYVADIIPTSYEDDDLRISYTSMTTPQQVVLYCYTDETKRVVKEKCVKGGFDRNLYETKRLWATSSDGVQVPYTICYRKSLMKELNNPVFMYGYGSYGYPLDPGFNMNYLSLMDRGFVVCLAHIRGGSDLGYSWYEAAKFTNKKKTFDDFIAIADDMILKKYTVAGEITICGGSAGGLLVGSVVNQRPELFKVVMALVPFVDVLNTMFDESLPLTPGEFSEWGNPKDKDIFDYMQSYCPYTNVLGQNYPAMYVTAGLNDPRVTYWEPAKWVAKLRAYKTDNNPLVFKTEMIAGHQGPSGRFEYLKEIADRYAFMFQQYGITDSA
jgi:oligopeptidase B